MTMCFPLCGGGLAAIVCSGLFAGAVPYKRFACVCVGGMCTGERSPCLQLLVNTPHHTTRDMEPVVAAGAPSGGPFCKRYCKLFPNQLEVEKGLPKLVTAICHATGGTPKLNRLLSSNFVSPPPLRGEKQNMVDVRHVAQGDAATSYLLHALFLMGGSVFFCCCLPLRPGLPHHEPDAAVSARARRFVVVGGAEQGDQGRQGSGKQGGFNFFALHISWLC